MSDDVAITDLSLDQVARLADVVQLGILAKRGGIEFCQRDDGRCTIWWRPWGEFPVPFIGDTLGEAVDKAHKRLTAALCKRASGGPNDELADVG